MCRIRSFSKMFSVGIIGFMGLDENGLSRDILCNRLVLLDWFVDSY